MFLCEFPQFESNFMTRAESKEFLEEVLIYMAILLQIFLYEMEERNNIITIIDCFKGKYRN